MMPFFYDVFLMPTGTLSIRVHHNFCISNHLNCMQHNLTSKEDEKIDFGGFCGFHESKAKSENVSANEIKINLP